MGNYKDFKDSIVISVLLIVTLIVVIVVLVLLGSKSKLDNSNTTRVLQNTKNEYFIVRSYIPSLQVILTFPDTEESAKHLKKQSQSIQEFDERLQSVKKEVNELNTTVFLDNKNKRKIQLLTQAVEHLELLKNDWEYILEYYDYPYESINHNLIQLEKIFVEIN